MLVYEVSEYTFKLGDPREILFDILSDIKIVYVRPYETKDGHIVAIERPIVRNSDGKIIVHKLTLNELEKYYGNNIITLDEITEEKEVIIDTTNLFNPVVINEKIISMTSDDYNDYLRTNLPKLVKLNFIPTPEILAVLKLSYNPSGFIFTAPEIFKKVYRNGILKEIIGTNNIFIKLPFNSMEAYELSKITSIISPNHYLLYQMSLEE